MQQNKKNLIKNAGIVVAYSLFIILIWLAISSIIGDKEAVQAAIGRFGIFAPLGFIIIQIMQNVAAPIAHYPILIAGGYIFGTIKGFFLNWIGTVIGSVLIILLTKRYGRPLVERMVSKRFIRKYDKIINRLGPYGLFIIYFLPGFPDDELTYLIGLSAMPRKDIYLAIILGKMGGATLSFIGHDPKGGIVPMIVTNAVMLVLGTIFYFRKRLLHLLRRGKKL